MSAQELRDVTSANYPVRKRSAHGLPRPKYQFTRACRVCGACFLELAPGKTGERGIWNDWRWYCSQECFAEAAS